MIITEQKPIAQILDSLKDAASVFLVGCGECATTCKTGGTTEVASLAQELIKSGKKVIGSCVPKAPCIAAQIKVEYAKNMAALRQADAIVVLSCGLGTQSAKDNDRLGKTVVPACDTICGAVVDGGNNFFEKCSMCGDCILGETAGICPVTLCPKGLLNGPCGGMDKGKCEVDKERDCVWVLIYNEQAKKGAAGALQTIQGPKDFKKATKPHKILAGK